MGAKRSVLRKDSNRSGGHDQWMTYYADYSGTLEMITDGQEGPCVTEESVEFSTFDGFGCARETEQNKWPPLTQQ
jgi:hypothetical protein